MKTPISDINLKHLCIVNLYITISLKNMGAM